MTWLSLLFFSIPCPKTPRANPPKTDGGQRKGLLKRLPVTGQDDDLAVLAIASTKDAVGVNPGSPHVQGPARLDALENGNHQAESELVRSVQPEWPKR